jgi:hypothetical protein
MTNLGYCVKYMEYIEQETFYLLGMNSLDFCHIFANYFYS